MALSKVHLIYLSNEPSLLHKNIMGWYWLFQLLVKPGKQCCFFFSSDRGINRIWPDEVSIIRNYCTPRKPRHPSIKSVNVHAQSHTLLLLHVWKQSSNMSQIKLIISPFFRQRFCINTTFVCSPKEGWHYISWCWDLCFFSLVSSVLMLKMTCISRLFTIIWILLKCVVIQILTHHASWKVTELSVAMEPVSQKLLWLAVQPSKSVHNKGNVRRKWNSPWVFSGSIH